ncbi:MAG: succinylglutamate desuccinylase/aspartoacylase family protein [Methanobacteriaceae archaeon]|nr:succinylglutamate desuccinylase/aspartoacylase family protein [Methanobacteriaceae archaeon]
MNLKIINNLKATKLALVILFILCTIFTAPAYADTELDNDYYSNSKTATDTSILSQDKLPDTIISDDTSNGLNIPNYTIKTFDSSVGADVTKNNEISKFIPRTPLSNQIFKLQKKGSTILKFGNGKGKKLLILAGIHGNEVESNIATMKYLEFLKNRKFEGTIYVIPFTIPKSTSLNSRNCKFKYQYIEIIKIKQRYRKSYKVRSRIWKREKYKSQGRWKYGWKGYWTYKIRYKNTYRIITKNIFKNGYKFGDPNRYANIIGTPGWKVVEFAKKNGIRYIIDVHSGGGIEKYNNGVVFATPGWSEESKWARHIKLKTGSFVTSGKKHPGMVNVYGNKLGINTLTLEVERDQGSSLQWANIQYKMIKAACNYLFPSLR